MLKALNSKWPTVQLVLNKISNDTVYIGIPESEYLTQRMGSTGAETFLVNALYNLTEINVINFVTFDFVEAYHLMPGTFSRDDFKITP
jgi:hypothetical protein